VPGIIAKPPTRPPVASRFAVLRHSHQYLMLALLLALLLALAMAIPGQAQSIAVIKSRDLASFDQVLASLVAACPPESGLELRHYNLKGKNNNAKDVAKKIHKNPPQFILALGLLAAQATKLHLSDIPVLYCMVSNPQRYDLVGENIVGISLDVPGETQFARYKAIVPNLRTIGVIYDPTKSEALVLEATEAASKLGLELISVPVSSHKKVPEALRGILGKIDALWTVPDDTVLTTDSFRFLLVTSLEHKLPFLAISDIFVKVGALATIAPVPDELGRQLCRLIASIQNGQVDLGKVDVLPPVQADLVINVKTAAKIGLELSPEILQSAGKLYQ